MEIKYNSQNILAKQSDTNTRMVNQAAKCIASTAIIFLLLHSMHYLSGWHCEDSMIVELGDLRLLEYESSEHIPMRLCSQNIF